MTKSNPPQIERTPEDIAQTQAFIERNAPKPPNKADAVLELIRDDHADRRSRTSYKRVLRYLKVLGLNEAERETVLHYMNYHHNGAPYPYLLEKPKS